MVEREELTGISAGLQIRRISIHDADGTELDVEEALDRRDDPDIYFCARSSLLVEASLTALPADPEAIVRAADPDAFFRHMMRDGEEKLRRILHPQRVRSGLVRVTMPPSGIQFHPAVSPR